MPGDRWRILGQQVGLKGEVGGPEKNSYCSSSDMAGLAKESMEGYLDVNWHLINLVSADQPSQLICWGEPSRANPAQR